MKKFGIYTLVALMTLGMQLNNGAQAKWGKLTVTDGSGNGFEAHEYPFGLGKGMQFQDQLGDSYGYKSGILGINRSTNASILGNGVKVHHGLISGTSIEGQSMFGDTVKSKKFLKIGPRITTVNVQGLHGLASGLMNHSATPGYDPNAYAGNLNSTTAGQALSRPEVPMNGGGPVDPNAYATPFSSP